MNAKFKRILSIFSLVFIGIMTVTFILYLFDKEMLGGTVKFILYVSAAIGLGTAIPLIFVHNGQKKQEARRKLYEDVAKAAEEKAAAEAAEAERLKAERIELDKQINKENNKK